MRAFAIAMALAAATAVFAGKVGLPASAGVPQPRPSVAPVSPGSDIGTGERVLLVVAGEYATRAQAEAANDALRFGDVQGFLVAHSDDFAELDPGRILLVSAFRTLRGAAEFEDLARIAGASALRRVVATYRGTTWIGLGQESRPDGTGPLLGPLPPGDPNAIR